MYWMRAVWKKRYRGTEWSEIVVKLPASGIRSVCKIISEVGERKKSQSTNLSACIRTSADNCVRGFFQISLAGAHPRPVNTTNDVDIIGHEGVNDEFLKRVPIQMSGKATYCYTRVRILTGL
jgi:hypothetical protein